MRRKSLAYEICCLVFGVGMQWLTESLHNLTRKAQSEINARPILRFGDSATVSVPSCICVSSGDYLRICLYDLD